MKTKCAFWIAGISVVLAAVLRCIQMLYFFDYRTGFVTDSGALTWAYGGVVVLVSVVCGLLCRLDGALCGKLRRESNGAVGVSSLFSALFLALCAVALFRDFHTYHDFGVSYFVSTVQVDAHLPFAVLSAAFSAASLVSAVAWLRGKGFPGRLGIFGAVGVVWGLCYMVLTFMTYSAAATTIENVFTVGGGAALLLFLLAEGKLLSGVDQRNAARDIYVFGLPAATLWLTYVLSNTVLIIAGRGYVTEMPYTIQLVMLLLSVHILALLLTFHGANFEPAPPAMKLLGRKNDTKRPENADKL